MMSCIVDQFGEEVETWKASEDTFCTKVKVAYSPAFYGWVFQLEGNIQIVEPEEIRERYRSMMSTANWMFRKKRKKERMKVTT